MDKCPECQQETLEFDPYAGVARCLRMRCAFRQTMSRPQYVEQFGDDRNVTDKLSFPYSEGLRS